MYEPFSVIVLSAGSSRRAEGPKALRTFGGGTWIEHVVAAWTRLGAKSITVVWNPALEVPPGLESARCRVVMNLNTELGPLHSAQLGLATLTDVRQLAVTPVDVPPPTAAMLELLRANASGRGAVHPEFGGKGGHPLLIARELFAEIAALDPRADRLDHYLKRAGALRLRVEDEMIVVNLNDEAAWRQWVAAHPETSPS